MTANPLICMKKYVRNVAWVNTGPRDFHCQFPRGHEGGCSWQPLKDTDELAGGSAEEENTEKEELIISTFLAGLLDGDWDDYLENILAVAHERKRALRGRRTFRPSPRR